MEGPSRMFSQVVKYIGQNKLVFTAGLYILFSSLVRIFFGIDIGIPCLWKSIFGINCPGCGLTTAFISLLEFDFEEAFRINWLIFIILPIGMVYVFLDFCKHRRPY